MESRERQKIRKNEKYLRDNVNVKNITTHLYQVKVLSVDDTERINAETTSSDQVRKLLRIVEKHPEGFRQLCHALDETESTHVSKQLQLTLVDEQEIEDGMCMFLVNTSLKD